jgi:type III restriction enzyme
VGKIRVQKAWKFPESISPGNLGPAIGQSLYEREGNTNGFEERVILDLSSLSNIYFWHRNIERRGFAINGFKSNHYPDFILYTKIGNVILLETKGDHLDGTDSAAKCRLGNQWQQLSGSGFSYFMVFDAKPITDSYTINQAKDMIRML